MKTNIATTALQSQHLLSCGVSAETADMIETRLGNLLNRTQDFPVDETKETLVWSLSALLGLLPKEICDECGDSFYFSLAKEFPLSEEYGAAYIPCWDKGDAIVRKRDNDPIEACVQLIEWLTENSYKLNEQ